MFRYSAARAFSGVPVKPLMTGFGNDQGFAPAIEDEAVHPRLRARTDTRIQGTANKVTSSAGGVS